MKTQNLVLFAANLGSMLFFSFIFTQMLLFGGTSHATLLFEPSLVVITVEVVMIWCLAFFDAVWVIKGLRAEKTRRRTFQSIEVPAVQKAVNTPNLNKADKHQSLADT